jgi:hypothetical protein
MFSTFKKCLSLAVAGLFFAGAFGAHANLLLALPKAGDLERWGVFSLGAGVFSDHLHDSINITGDVGVAGNGNNELNGNTLITGDYYYQSNGTLNMSGAASITGARFHDQDAQLDNGVAEAIAASNHAFSLAPTRALTDVSLGGNGPSALTVTGAIGETVVLSLRSFIMRGDSTFTLQGTATTIFIINVKRQFSLTDRARIVLSGGVTWDDVLFNVRGKGNTVTLGGNADFQGVLLATKRTVQLSGHSQVDGEIIANKVLLRGASQVNRPPIASP